MSSILKNIDKKITTIYVKGKHIAYEVQQYISKELNVIVPVTIDYDGPTMNNMYYFYIDYDVLSDSDIEVLEKAFGKRKDIGSVTKNIFVKVFQTFTVQRINEFGALHDKHETLFPIKFDDLDYKNFLKQRKDQ